MLSWTGRNARANEKFTLEPCMPLLHTCMRAVQSVALARVEATANSLVEEEGGARLAMNRLLLGTPIRAVSRGLWRRALDD